MRVDAIMAPLVLTILVQVCLTQGPEAQDKLFLAKNTVVPFYLGNKTVQGVTSPSLLVELYVGKEVNETTPVQKAKFWIEFRNGRTWGLPHNPECQSGFNTTEQAGFTKQNFRAEFEYQGQDYGAKVFSTWLRFDPKHRLTSKTPQSEFAILEDCAKWVKNQKDEFGVINLGPGPNFWDSFLKTYNPEPNVGDRIPVSWSLNPADEDHLFDSRASYLNGSFILNGFRSKNKRQGMKYSNGNGVAWYYSSMRFKLGSKWSSIEGVCIDPSADTFLGMPTEQYNKVWQVIQEGICSGNSTYTCDYSRANLTNMTALEISLDASASSGPDLSLNGSDIIKQNAEGAFLRKGITSTSSLNSACGDSWVILGKWFFTKVELTLWLQANRVTDETVELSFSYVADQNQKKQPPQPDTPKKKEDPSSSSLGLLIGGIIAVVLLLTVVGIVIYKKSSGSGSSEYHSGSEDIHDVSSRSFEGKA